MQSTRVEDFRLEDWLPYWLSADQLIAGLAALAVLVACLAIWQALSGRNPFERRYTEIAQRRDSLRQAALDTKRRGRQPVTAASLMNAIVTRLNLLRSQHAQDARMLLAQAGMRSNEAMIRYLFARLAMPFVFGAIVMADTYGARLLPIPEHLRMFAAFGAAVLGFFATDVFIKDLVKKRSHQMELGLPDSLDLLVICAEAGLSLDAALVRVSRELEQTWPELSEEFGLTAAELTYFPERKLAFDNLNARTNMASIRGVVNTLLQTAKFGTPLAQSLRILASEYREARITRAEEKAARLPAMLTVPMILFILPTLFIVLLGPAMLSVLDTFSNKKRPPAHQTQTVKRAPPADQFRTTTVFIEESARPVKSIDPGPLPTEATIVPVETSVQTGDLVTVDFDARALRNGSQHRVVIMPADNPETVAISDAILRSSVPVPPDRVRVSLAATLPGPSEVRLYYLPASGATLVLAARAPLMVGGPN
jgi:tight adherence protein C